MSVWKLSAPVMGAFGLMFAVSSYAATYEPPATMLTSVAATMPPAFT